MRIPFDISKRPQIESGEYKVVYVENSSMEQYPVEILKWDSNSDAGCIVGCIRRKGKDRIYVFGENGKHKVSDEGDRLFIVTPEPEMNEWELAIAKYRPPTDSKETIQKIAAELLALAKQQLLQSGELLTQEHHEKLMETLDKAFQTELREAKIKEYNAGFIHGEREVIVDMPRWRIWENGACGNSEGYPIALVHNGCGFDLVSTLGAGGEKYIMLSDLEELPGFNDEDHE